MRFKKRAAGVRRKLRDERAQPALGAGEIMVSEIAFDHSHRRSRVELADRREVVHFAVEDDALGRQAARRSDEADKLHNVPLISCSRSIASNSALKFPLPKLLEPWRSIISKKTVGRSSTG